MLKLDKSKKYLLACSFGPDSMALFDMLEKQGINFMVGHVNYGVRPEAIKETQDLNIYCAKHDIEIEIFYVKSPINEGNFEAKAREIRYKFFKELYDENNIDALLVAHQQDDVIETFILQKKRGGFVERFGINENTNIYGMNVIRPLLDYSKQDLLDYCINNKVPYAIDSSNLLEEFERNIIRINMVSKMNHMERVTQLKEISDLNASIDNILNKLQSIDINSVHDLLNLEDDELQRAFVLKARKVEPNASISSSLTKELKKILLSDKPNVVFKIHKGLIFVKEYEWCDFTNENKDILYSFTIESPKVLETQYFYIDLTKDTSRQNITKDDYPITIRTHKDDDFIKINNYRSEVRRLFIDWKMPASLRKRWPIIVNKDNIVIYVPRYRKDFKKEPDLNFFVKF